MTNIKENIHVEIAKCRLSPNDIRYSRSFGNIKIQMFHGLSPMPRWNLFDVVWRGKSILLLTQRFTQYLKESSTLNWFSGAAVDGSPAVQRDAGSSPRLITTFFFFFSFCSNIIFNKKKIVTNPQWKYNFFLSYLHNVTQIYQKMNEVSVGIRHQYVQVLPNLREG